MEYNVKFDENGQFLGDLPAECVDECTHAGDCYPDTEYWVKELGFSVPEKLARAYLQEFGAWEDLDNCTQVELDRRCLWLACLDIKEDGEWFGLIH